ncbi:hypothetical protein [Pseudorhodoferax sp.]|uniref:hypothetical protein n=1 Tax=Pseudorhodoferax sp. TaxID=1993553 RepID=UPI0039E40A51
MPAAPAEAGAVRPRPVRPDWVSKTLAGLLLGFSLSLVAAGLLMTQLPGMPLPVSGQLAMWLVPPVWLGVLSGVYFFSSGLRAWAWLLGANVVALGVWWLVRQGGAA